MVGYGQLKNFEKIGKSDLIKKWLNQKVTWGLNIPTYYFHAPDGIRSPHFQQSSGHTPSP
jgi:hypothetical protein